MFKHQALATISYFFLWSDFDKLGPVVFWWQIGPLESLSGANWALANWAPANLAQEKLGCGELGPSKLGPWKNFMRQTGKKYPVQN